MVCWGHDGNFDELLTYPHGAYRALDVALSTTCGITTAGEAVCWGYNGGGQADAPDGRYIGDAGKASDEALSGRGHRRYPQFVLRPHRRWQCGLLGRI